MQELYRPEMSCVVTGRSWPRNHDGISTMTLRVIVIVIFRYRHKALQG